MERALFVVLVLLMVFIADSQSEETDEKSSVGHKRALLEKLGLHAWPSNPNADHALAPRHKKPKKKKPKKGKGYGKKKSGSSNKSGSSGSSGGHGSKKSGTSGTSGSSGSCTSGSEGEYQYTW